MKNVRRIEEVGNKDIDDTGELAANLGEISSEDKINTSTGFVLTEKFYKDFLKHADLRDKINGLLDGIETENPGNVQKRAEKIRSQIEESSFRGEQLEKLNEIFTRLQEENSAPFSATLSTQHSNKVFNLTNDEEKKFSDLEEMLSEVKKLYSRIFENEDIIRREENGLDHFKPSPAVIIRTSPTNNVKSSGIATSYDPESKTGRVVDIISSYGTLEGVHDNRVNTDGFTVYKKTLGIVEKTVSEKEKRTVYENDGRMKTRKVPAGKREKPSLTDNRIKELSNYCQEIEEKLGSPVKIEWVLDHSTREIEIRNIKREDIELKNNTKSVELHKSEEDYEALIEGEAVGDGFITGEVNIVNSPHEVKDLSRGDIIVTDHISKDWIPAVEKAAAVVTNRGGRVSEPAVITREIEKPGVIGTERASSVLSDGEKITLNLKTGQVVRGKISFSSESHLKSELPETETDLFLDFESGERSLNQTGHSADGAQIDIGSVITKQVNKNPVKLIDEDKESYIQEIRSEISKFLVAGDGKEQIIKLNDLGKEELENMEPGEIEHKGEDLRGASLYNSSYYSEAFDTELEAVKQAVRRTEPEEVYLAVPLCRDIQESKDVLAKLKRKGLNKEINGVYLVVESPSNIVRAQEFSELFDGFIIDTESLKKSVLSSKNPEKYEASDPAVAESIRNMVQRLDSDNKVILDGNLDEFDTESLRNLFNHGMNGVVTQPEDYVEQLWRTVDVEDGEVDQGYEFDIEGMVGTPAGEIHEALETHGKATAENLEKLTHSKIDIETVHQALGWLAKEGKLAIEQTENGVSFSLQR